MGINKGILEPCPYCGGKAKLKSALDMVNWVKCSVCSAESGSYCTEEEAIVAWNKVSRGNKTGREILEKINTSLKTNIGRLKVHRIYSEYADGYINGYYAAAKDVKELFEEKNQT